MTVGCQPRIFSSYLYCFSEHLLVWSPVSCGGSLFTTQFVCSSALNIDRYSYVGSPELPYSFAKREWCPKWDLNPQNSGFESDTYANSVIRAYRILKVCTPYSSITGTVSPLLEERYLLGILSFCDTSNVLV